MLDVCDIRTDEIDIKGDDMKGNVHFLWNGIKVNGTVYRCRYSSGPYVTLPPDVITIYSKDYKPFPAISGLTVQNDTDIMTDYFEKDRIRVYPDNEHYPAILQAFNKMKSHEDKMKAKGVQL